MKRRFGFSLIEMAVVLTIIGLLLAVVTASDSVISKAKTRGVIAEIGKLRAYIADFQASYDSALPGDMRRAHDYFDSECAADSNAPSGCNGNGNGYIGFSTHESGVEESYRFWQHLQLANILEQQVSGVKNSSAPYANNLNSYESKAIKGAIYFPEFPYDWSAGQFHSSSIKNSNIFILGRPHSTLEQPYDRALTPQIAHDIDSKIDDEKPRVGKIKAYNYNDTANGWHGSSSGFSARTECTSLGHGTKTDAELFSAYYELALKSEECILLIDF